MHMLLSRTLLSATLLLTNCCGASAQTRTAAQPAPAENVILVMSDGLRWQEVFRGADETLLTPANYWDGRSVADLKTRFLAPTPEERRMQLMPFLWGTLVKNGQIYGDRDAHSDMHVTNGLNFSYPGYSETLTGHPDPRIHTNDNVPNPNQTVLGWLNHQPGFQNQVAAFGAWDVIASAVNPERCGCVVNAGYAPLTVPPVSERLAQLNKLKAESPRVWDDEVFDAPEFDTAMEYVRAHHPRVLFISLGETDDWAHGGNYGEYLLSANRADSYLRQLWTALQAMPQYSGKTTLIFTTDHGRGDAANKGWQSHGEKLPESKYIFAGFLGAGVPAAGVLSNTPDHTQNQIAATMANLLGKDWNTAEPQAGMPIKLGK